MVDREGLDSPGSRPCRARPRPSRTPPGPDELRAPDVEVPVDPEVAVELLPARDARACLEVALHPRRVLGRSAHTHPHRLEVGADTLTTPSQSGVVEQGDRGLRRSRGDAPGWSGRAAPRRRTPRPSCSSTRPARGAVPVPSGCRRRPARLVVGTARRRRARGPRGDLGGVGADDAPGDRGIHRGGPQAVADQRESRQRPEVLAGQALRAAASRNHHEDACWLLPGSVMPGPYGPILSQMTPLARSSRRSTRSGSSDRPLSTSSPRPA